jgi:hypothetical protein
VDALVERQKRLSYQWHYFVRNLKRRMRRKAMGRGRASGRWNGLPGLHIESAPSTNATQRRFTGFHDAADY